MSENVEDVVPESVVKMFGEHLLRYILVAELRAIEPSDERRVAVIASLQAIASRAARDGMDAFGRRRMLISLLSAQIEGAGWANSMRELCGGNFPSISSEDEVAVKLFELALVAYAIELLPIEANDPHFPISDIPSVVLQHPAHDAFIEAWMRDADLAKLFPDPIGTPPEGYSIGKERHVNLLWSTGAGGSLDLRLVASSVLAFMFSQMRINSHSGVSHLPAYVISTIDVVRRLATNSRATVPCVVALSNLTVRTSAPSRVGAGHLLDVEPFRGRDWSGGASTSAVIIMPVELRLLDVIPTNFDDDHSNLANDSFGRRLFHRQPMFEAAHQSLTREITRVRLALALASSDKQTVGPPVRGWTVLNPFLSGYSGWGLNPYVTASITGGAEVDDQLALAITEWGDRVGGHPVSMWMGARRLLTAISDRQDPLDAFIDAVIVWENLLGAEAEVSFRLSAALALLLEPHDATKRLALYEEVRKLYGVRSGLVHGSREPKSADSHAHAMRAISIAISATRAIYDRSDLMEADSSGERNRRLLLGT